MLLRHGEAELIVIAAGQRQLPRILLAHCILQHRRERQQIEIDLGPHAGRLENVAEIRCQTVGEIQRTARQSAQCLSGQNAGMGMVEARQHGRQLVLVEGAFAQQVGERQGCISQSAGHIDAVTGFGTAAHQSATGRHRPLDRHRDGERPAGHVPAHQRHVVVLGELKESFGKAGDPALVDGRQRQRQRDPARFGPHGGEIGEIDRQRLVAEIDRIHVGEEVHAADQGIRAHRQLGVGGQGQQGAVVSRAHHHVLAGVGDLEVLINQLEFTHTVKSQR